MKFIFVCKLLDRMFYLNSFKIKINSSIESIYDINYSLIPTTACKPPKTNNREEARMGYL